MFNLGALMEDGRGTRKDDVTAARWIFKAIKGGNEFARTQMMRNVGTYSLAFRRELQRLMRQEGVYDGPIAGAFGPATKQARITGKAIDHRLADFPVAAGARNTKPLRNAGSRTGRSEALSSHGEKLLMEMPIH